MSDGNARVMSEVGLVNQRYYIVMKGSAGSWRSVRTGELFKQSVDFSASPNVWYHLAAGGRGGRQFRAWCAGSSGRKDDAEPAAWTLRCRRSTSVSGSRGCSRLLRRKRTYIDNIKVTPN